MKHEILSHQGKKIKCKYFNLDFCKFEVPCKFFHPNILCTNTNCSNRKCAHRHLKMCRYKEKCKRKENCSYRYTNDIQTDTQKMEAKCLAENAKLKSEIDGLKAKLEETKSKINQIYEESNSVKFEVAQMYTEFSKFKDLKCAFELLKEHVLKIEEENKLLKAHMTQYMNTFKQDESVVENSIESTESMDIERNQEIVKCGHCEYEYGCHEFLLQHMLRIHKNELDIDEFMLVSTEMKNSCAKCNFQGSNLQNLTMHIVVDHNKRKRACLECGKHFVNGHHLVDHIQKETLDNRNKIHMKMC